MDINANSETKVPVENTVMDTNICNGHIDSTAKDRVPGSGKVNGPENGHVIGLVEKESDPFLEKAKNIEKDDDDDESDIELTRSQRACHIVKVILRFILLIILLYFFICSLDLLSSAFTLIGGRAAGQAFKSSLLSNPICGLMVGVVCTALLQSSSTSTSIVITMVAGNIMSVQMAIPIIMGANIGTSVTGILVSVSQAGEREQFRRAFAAATVHDMFNWLTVIILLPIEVITGYLRHLTGAIIKSTSLETGGSNQAFLKALTEPFTQFIVHLDKSVLDDIAKDDPIAANKSFLKYWCEWETVPLLSEEGTGTIDVPVGTSPQPVGPLGTSQPVLAAQNGSDSVESAMLVATGTVSSYTSTIPTQIIGIQECRYIFHGTVLREAVVGTIILLIALVILVTCLIFMVKILKSLLHGHMASVITKTINADFPGIFACLTGYVAIVIGAIVTMLVQSSSVVASALTPLVGVGMVSIDRVYPMMLGANIGTTSTAILASFAAGSDTIVSAFQIALCHLFFNLTGILIWFPIPFMRKVPIRLATFLGDTTARYRWFAVMYLLCMFFFFPLGVFALSIPGWYVLAAVLIPVVLLLATIGIINLLQNKRPRWLPRVLRNWEFLPECMRSLAPLDRLVTRLISCCSCCWCCRKREGSRLGSEPTSIDVEEELKDIVLSVHADLDKQGDANV